jgi:hypothetical protein
MLLPWRLGHGVISMSSHAGDVVVVVIWSRRDVDVESYW